jgi:hypothetical protein
MQIAFQITDGALPRRVIAERDMHVRVDQARDRRHAAGIDHHIGALDLTGRRGADLGDALAVADDGVAGDTWRAPVAGNDMADINDRDFHSARSCALRKRASLARIGWRRNADCLERPIRFSAGPPVAFCPSLKRRKGMVPSADDEDCRCLIAIRRMISSNAERVGPCRAGGGINERSVVGRASL